jgi:transcriptional regulator with XRE-family HTH domain
MSIEIGNRLRSLRKARGLSQEAVARQTNIGLKAYGDLERGRTIDPHYSTLEGIAHALGTTVAELVGEEPTEEVITFDDEAVRAAITAAKAGKLTTKEAARAIAYSVRGGPVDALEDAVELLLEHAEASREEVEA